MQTSRDTFADYREIEAANISTLQHMARSPLHYLHAVRNQTPLDSPSLSFGRIVHMAVLEPDRYRDGVAIWPRDNGRRYGTGWETFRSDNEGKEIVTQDDHATCQAMSAMLRAHPVAGPLLMSVGDCERTVQWTDPDDSIACKGRLDKICDGGNLIIDLKTAASADAVRFGYAAAQYEYHAKAAYYADGWRAITGCDAAFTLIVVEKKPPHAVAVYTVGEAPMQAGRERYKAWLAKLAYCRAHNEWPGLGGDTAQELCLPEWAFMTGTTADLIFDGGET